MIDKEYNKLSSKELFKLDKIMKKFKNETTLTDEEQKLYNKFIKDYTAEIAAQKKKKPYYIAAFVIMLIALLFDWF